MPLKTAPKDSPAARAAEDHAPRYRSGAVARMVRVPVATLRIWESRYRIASPTTTAAGHRLYTAADVRRLALLKQLTEVGHAIGTLAGLSMAQLHDVAATHAGTLAGAGARIAPSSKAARTAAPSPSRRPWRVVSVGDVWKVRLGQQAVVRRLVRPTEVVSAFADLAEATATPRRGRVDALLVHAPTLHDDALPLLKSAADAHGARRILVLHGPAAAATCQALERAGVGLLREPQDAASLAACLQKFAADASPSSFAITSAPTQMQTSARDSAMLPGPAGPRRYDDATLADFAGLSSTIACECPRQVAELLRQLSAFELYSAECASRSPADAELHQFLERMAGRARSLFESALERVAVSEGLVLPTSDGVRRRRR